MKRWVISVLAIVACGPKATNSTPAVTRSTASSAPAQPGSQALAGADAVRVANEVVRLARR